MRGRQRRVEVAPEGQGEGQTSFRKLDGRLDRGFQRLPALAVDGIQTPDHSALGNGRGRTRRVAVFFNQDGPLCDGDVRLRR